MSFDQMGRSGLEYFPCRYGQSRAAFRGPKRPVDGDFLAFLGGAETYGRFIAQPFPAILEARLGLPAVNLGWVNAGPDAYLSDPDLLEVISSARAVVIQVMGAQNMSNRFYAVHPRRNDRFLQATGLMRSLYDDVDFTEFNFTRHLLTALHDRSVERFAMLRGELRAAWVIRMEALIARIPVPVVLLWFAGHAPDHSDGGLEAEPLFVTREMLDSLSSRVAGYVEVVPTPGTLSQGAAGMIFSPMEAPAAGMAMPCAAHAEVAERLLPELSAIIGR